MKGRFPADLLVSNDVLNDGDIYSTHSTGKHDLSEYKRKSLFFGQHQGPGKYSSDSGSFSRYFDLDAWWQETLKAFPVKLRQYLEENGEA